MKRLIIVSSLLSVCLIAGAQVIENDAAFRIGKLDNGMTYYLCHNENPSRCADFYIAHNVGALQEEDNQNGLAHFLEHMAFNGTKHYPDKGILNFLAKEGVRFGYNVNAYTSRNETVYNIDNVPLVRDSFVDSVLLILHDWSCDISCEQDALDAERGVISEEWRLNDDQRWRMNQKQIGLVYKGGKHPRRTVLGTLEIINGFKREEILDFYHKWYRPDLQAVIVVGDIDVDAMEQKVREKFSDIAMPENPPQKDSTYLPPHRNGILRENMMDPAVNYTVAKVIYKQPYPTREQLRDEASVKDYFYRCIISSIMSDRLRERMKDRNSPVHSAVLVTSELKPDYYQSLFTVTPKKSHDFLSAFDFTLTEVRRMVEFGISEEEFEIAKLNLRTRLHLDNELGGEELKNNRYVKACIENFLRGAPCITPSHQREIQRKLFAGLSYDEVKAYPSKMFVESEDIYSSCLNEKDADKAPTFEQMRAMEEQVKTRALVPLFLKYPRMDMKIDATAGTVKSRKALGKEGVEKLTLSNGVTVYLRQCAPVDNSIHFTMGCRFDGGYNRLEQDKIASSEFALSFLRRFSGFRNVSRMNFKNYPEIADISLFFSAKYDYSEMIIFSDAKKIENAFKCAYLQIMDPYFSTEQNLSGLSAERLKSLAKGTTDRAKFENDREAVEFGNHPWLGELDSAAVQAVTPEFVEGVFDRLFTDVKSMKVYICTDAPVAQIEDYLCRYIASIDRGYPYKLANERPVRPAYKGTKEFFRTAPKVNAPMCKISCNFSTSIKKTTKDRVVIAIFDYLMSARYLNLIREERGGAYHASLATAVGTDPKAPIVASVDFQTRPVLRETLLKDVKEEMERMSQSGPTEQEMEVAKKYFAKAYAERKPVTANSISRMQEQLTDWVEGGVDYDYDYNAVLSSIEASDIQTLASKLLKGNSFIAVYSEE